MYIKNTIRLIALVTCVTLVGCNKDSISEMKSPSSTLQIASESFKNVRKKIAGQYIVTLNEGTLAESKKTLAAKGQSFKGKDNYIKVEKAIKGEIAKMLAGKVNGGDIIHAFAFATEGFSATLSPDQVEQLKADNRVKSVSEDFMITLAPPNKGGGGTSPAQIVPWGVTRVGGPKDGTGKRAWIIDSGIDLDHPDLKVNTSLSISFTGDNNPDDGAGHGTHVAGTVAALNNAIGVIGVAPGAEVVSVKVLNSRGTGDFSWTVSALDYVAANGSPGDAINMSLGPDSPYIDAATDAAVIWVANLGIKIAIAAGNESDDCNLYSPAHNNHANVYTVSAIAEGDVFTYFSNYGTSIDLAAPGYKVISSVPGGLYDSYNGTSMAAPHVCGLLLHNEANTDGRRILANYYWELKWSKGGGYSATGKSSPTNIYANSQQAKDLDGIRELVAVR